MVYMITGPGALRRHVWDYQQERTLCGRDLERLTPRVTEILRAVSCGVCQVELNRYITALRQLRLRLGETLFDDVVQAGWSDQGTGERTGKRLAGDLLLAGD